MKTPIILSILIILAASTVQARDLTTTVAVQQALATPRDGVSRHEMVNNLNSGNMATVCTDGAGNAVIFAPKETIYVQPSPWGGVNMFSTGGTQRDCNVECP